MEKSFKISKRRKSITKYCIIYSNRAKRQQRKAINNLKKYYPTTSDKFYKNLMHKLQLLQISPPMYQIYQEPNKRKIPLMYGYMLIYEIQNNTIYISDILNSKQENPNINLKNQY